MLLGWEQWVSSQGISSPHLFSQETQQQQQQQEQRPQRDSWEQQRLMATFGPYYARGSRVSSSGCGVVASAEGWDAQHSFPASLLRLCWQRSFTVEEVTRQWTVESRASRSSYASFLFYNFSQLRPVNPRSALSLCRLDPSGGGCVVKGGVRRLQAKGVIAGEAPRGLG